MKKIIIILTAALLLAVCTVPILAGEVPFRTAGDLYTYWMENGVCPDYVTGVWSTDGGIENLTIAVQDTEEGRRGMEEILAAISEDSTVTFAYQEYSRNYLYSVQEELLPWFEADCGLVSAGVHDTDNRLHLGILTERKGDPETEAMLADLRAKYGDIFTVEYTGYPVTTLEKRLTTPPIEQPSLAASAAPWIFLAAILLLLTAGLWITLRRRNLLLMQTSAGRTVSAPLSRLETEEAVKESVISVPPALDERIMAAVRKSE